MRIGLGRLIVFTILAWIVIHSTPALCQGVECSYVYYTIVRTITYVTTSFYEQIFHITTTITYVQGGTTTTTTTVMTTRYTATNYISYITTSTAGVNATWICTVPTYTAPEVTPGSLPVETTWGVLDAVHVAATGVLLFMAAAYAVSGSRGEYLVALIILAVLLFGLQIAFGPNLYAMALQAAAIIGTVLFYIMGRP
ncbi:MAG: hypothetical protein QXD60_03860 [Nanopusillaceae archaeon]